MPAEKTDAIILRVVDFSETSCIVTLLTRDFGKITGIAKGARRPKSPFEAAIDVLAICRIVFIPKTNAMSLLTEAKLEHRFRAGEANLSRLYVGYYVVELLRILTDEGDPQPDVFELTTNMVRYLDTAHANLEDLRFRLLQFELGLLDLLGHLPMLTRCVNCGREKTTLSKVNFGLHSGGILCHQCRRGQANIVTISEAAFQVLLSLVGGQIGADKQNSDNWNQPDRINENRLKNRSWLPPQSTQKNNQEFKQPDEPDNGDLRSTAATETVVSASDEMVEVRRLVNQYITHLIGYPPRLHRFLQNL
ncbi:MAG: DNA repair protein RecO [Planctomycetota bacterium]